MSLCWAASFDDQMRDGRVANALPVTIRPPFGRRAKAAMSRSISFGVAHIDRRHLHPQRRRHGLDCGELTEPGGNGGVPKDGRACHAWHNLFEQLQPFCAETVFEREEARGVAAWPRQAGDESSADRIRDDHEYDRHGVVAPCSSAPRSLAALGEDHLRRECDHFRCVLASGGNVRAKTEVELDIAAIGPAQFLQSVRERGEAGLRFRIVGGRGHEHADAPASLGCCARAASGHAAAPPSSVMNSRRLV